MLHIRSSFAGVGGVLLATSLIFGCSSRSGGDIPGIPSEGGNGGTACIAGSALPGASYEITKSHFAFGSTPVAVAAGSLTRWTGKDGVVAIFTDGSELASLNGGAPEANRADWSSDRVALTQHVVAYFESMGAQSCEISGTNIYGSAGGGGSADGGFVITFSSSAVLLARGIGGVPVAESIASARFDVDDKTTSESFYWPTIPADVVAAASAFHDRLTDSQQLAAYKTLLPAADQGDGQVVIHHSHAGATSPFASAATYDVQRAGSQLGLGSTDSFDASGTPVPNDW